MQTKTLKDLIQLAIRLLVLAAVQFAVCSHVCAANEYNISFTGKSLDLTTLNTFGEVSSIEGHDDGCKVANDNLIQNTGLNCRLPISGDFSITCDVKLLDFPPPSEGYGTGVTILIEDQKSCGASLQLVRSTEGKVIFVSHSFTVSSSGEYEHAAKVTPSESTTASLKLVREGASLHYDVDTLGEGNYERLHTLEFTQDPMKTVQFYAQPGGQANDTKILIRSIGIKADQIGDLDASAKRNTLIIAGIACTLFSVAILFVFMKRNATRDN